MINNLVVYSPIVYFFEVIFSNANNDETNEGQKSLDVEKNGPAILWNQEVGENNYEEEDDAEADEEQAVDLVAYFEAIDGMGEGSDYGEVTCFKNPGHCDPGFVETAVIAHAAEGTDNGDLKD